MSSRVLWDSVPDEVKTHLAARANPREGDTAIVDREDPRERWYFRRTRHGWNHLSVDREPGTETGSLMSDDSTIKILAATLKEMGDAATRDKEFQDRLKAVTEKHAKVVTHRQPNLQVNP